MLGKFCICVYNLVKDLVFIMMLLSIYLYNGSYSNSRVFLEVDVIKFGFFSNLFEEGCEDFRKDFILLCIFVGEKNI